MLKWILVGSFAALAASAQTAAPPTAPATKSAFDKPTFEAYVRHLFLYASNIKIEVRDPKPSELPGFKEVSIRASLGDAAEEKTFFVSNDGLKIVQGQAFDVRNNPFKPELDRIKTDFAPSLGTPGAPVVLVLYSDFQCQFCRDEAKMLRENLLKEYPTQVRLYFKDFPLASIHDWAKPAAIAGRCISQQQPLAFWDYHDWVFEHQTEITAANFSEKLAEFAKSKNLDSGQLTACTSRPSTAADIDRSTAEARTLGVNSTPTMFINGRRIAFAIKWPNLKQVIDFEIGYQATNKNAGEHCCSLTLPDPLNRK